MKIKLFNLHIVHLSPIPIIVKWFKDYIIYQEVIKLQYLNNKLLDKH